VHFFGSQGVFYPEKKSPKSFIAFGLHFGIDILQSKKQAKNNNLHWALCQ
jgi:hypothetical protein